MQNNIPPELKEQTQFLEYIKNTRKQFADKFTTKFNSMPANYRVMIEDLLMAYDQMKNRMEAYTLGQQGRWISVQDRLPDSNGSYLAVLGEITVVLYWQNLSKRFETAYGLVEPTHWQPLPTPPKI